MAVGSALSPATRVFISHRWAQGEEEFSGELALRLAKYDGLDIKIDRSSLIAGDNIQEWMRDSVKRADVLIYILSPSANESENCQRELRLARRHRKPIIPVMLRKANLPDQIGNLMYLDFRGAEHLPFYKVEELVRAIRHQQEKALAAHKTAAIGTKPSAKPSPVSSYVFRRGFVMVSARIAPSDTELSSAELEINVESLSGIPRSCLISVRSLESGIRFKDGTSGAMVDNSLVNIQVSRSLLSKTIIPVLIENIGSRVAAIEISLAVSDPFGGTQQLGSFPVSLSLPNA
jgi:hypothetical protein